MEKKQQKYIIKGMNRDLSISKTSPEFSFYNKNIRIDSNSEEELYSISPEKSTKDIIDLRGSVLGVCKTDTTIVLFIKDDKDRIIEFTGNELKVLAEGNLNFKENTIIDAVFDYENNDFKKVYFTDGVNPLRSINISSKELPIIKDGYIHELDSVPKLKLKEEINISKQYDNTGLFPSGIIRYAISYSKVNSLESPIVGLSKVYYISKEDKGLSPEETGRCSFTLNISNIENEFWDYLLVYSIIYSSQNSTPIVSLVEKIPTKTINNFRLKVKDTNINNTVVSTHKLLYLGAENIIPKNLEISDNVLFLSNYKLNRILTPKLSSEYSNEHIKEVPKVNELNKTINISINNGVNSRYTLDTTLPQEYIRTFRKGNYYHLGVVLQHYSGKFSNPIFLNTYQFQGEGVEINGDEYYPKMITLTIPEELKNLDGYIKAYPVISHIQNNTVVSQGVLNPSIYNVGDRQSNSPYAQSSWFFRADPGTLSTRMSIAYKHNEPVKDCTAPGSEIVNLYSIDTDLINYNSVYSWKARENYFKVDRSICSFYSPEFEFGNLGYLSDIHLHINKLGSINYADRSIQINTKTAVKYVEGDSLLGGQLYNKDLILEANNKFSYIPLNSFPMYRENCLGTVWDFYIYPFHNTDGIAGNKGGDEKTSVAGTKIVYNKRYIQSLTNVDININIEDNVVIDSIEDKIYEIKKSGSSIFYKNYYDKLLTGGGNSGDRKLSYYVQTRNNTARPLTLESMEKEGYHRDFMKGHDGGIFRYAKEPVPITYKSSKHLCLSLNSTLPIYSNNVGDEDTVLLDNQLYDVLNNIRVSLNRDYSDSDTLTFEYYSFRDNLDFALKVFNIFNKKVLPKIIERYTLKKYGQKHLDGISYTVIKTPYIHHRKKTKYIRTEVRFKDYNLPRGTLGYTEGTIPYMDITVKNILNNILMFRKYRSSDYSLEIISENVSNRVLFEGKEFYITVVVRIVMNDNIIPPNIGELKRVLNNRNSSLYLDSTKILEYDNEKNITVYVEHMFGPGGEIAGSDFSNIVKTNLSYSIQDIFISKLVDIDFSVNETKAITNEESGFILIGNVLRQNVNLDRDNIKWLIAGDGVLLEDSDTINYELGDSYFQVFNALGCMARDNKDANQIVDILRFPTESYFNLDYLYDSNRNITNTNVNETNFNLRNPIYDSTHDYFSFYEDTSYNKSTDYTTSITISDPKIPVSDKDSFMDIKAINSRYTNGSYGEIVRLINRKDDVVGFQQRGIFRVLYNSRVQVQASDNVPIEIASSGKFEGIKYISSNLGCNHYHSICSTKKGIYFIDSFTKNLYLLNDSIEDISSNKGFSEFFSGLDGITRLYYDYYNEDLYIVNKECLRYSTKLGVFETFLDYDNYQMFNINEDLFSISKEKIWEHFKGEGYLNLYNNINPFVITYRVSPPGSSNKIFTNVDIQGDSFTEYGLKDTLNIKKIEVDNEYQYASKELVFDKRSPSDIKKKFRLWRINIPRHNGTMNRIVNPWCYITITSDDNPEKTIIHDIAVTYYE